MRARASERRPNLALLAVFWLGIQAVWGALLGISLQARSYHLAGAHAVQTYGLLAASGATVACVVQILAGAASDRARNGGGSRVPFYAFGAAIAACGIAWFYAAPNVAQLIGAYALLQIGMNVAMGAYQAILPDVVTPRERGAASAWMAGLQSLGNAIGAVAASLAGDPVVAALLVVLLLTTCALTSVHVAHLGRMPASEVAPSVARRTLVDLFVSRFALYVGFYTLLGYVYFYVRDTLGAGSAATADTGRLLLAFTVAGALGAALAARPSDRADKRVVAGTAGALFALCLLALGLTSSWGVTAGATIGAGVAWGGFLVADWALGCRMMPQTATARAMAIWNLAVAVPQVAAPAFATVVLGWASLPATAGPRLALLLGIAEAVTGIVWLMRLPRGLARE